MAELEDGLLEGEVVLVSGATQGLVAGIAAAAARNDVADVVTGRRQEAGGEVAARIREGGGEDTRRRGEGGSIVNILSAHGGQPQPGAVREVEFGDGRARQERRVRAPVGPDPHQRTQHRVDRDRWGGRHPASVPRRRGGVAGSGRRDPPHGQLGQVDEIADFVVLLLSPRSGVVTGSVIDRDQTVPGASD